MSTQPTSEAHDPSEARDPGLENPPAFEESLIRIRPDGRQLVIHRGERPTGDPDEDEADCGPLTAGPIDAGEDPAGEAGGERTSTRGEITEFSEDSRRRCRSLLHSLRRSENIQLLFVTLTYHETEPGPDQAHRDLDTFWKRLQRRLPHLSCVWKLEPQKRGVPHFHLILVGTEFIPAQKVSRLWHEVTAETSEAHRKSGVDVEPVWGNQDGKIQAYISEYLSEESEGEWPDAGGEEWERPGRFWGVLGRSRLPVAPWADWCVYIDHAEAARLIRDLLDRWDTDIPEGVLPPSLTINTRGDPTEVLEDLLDRL